MPTAVGVQCEIKPDMSESNERNTAIMYVLYATMAPS